MKLSKKMIIVLALFLLLIYFGVLFFVWLKGKDLAVEKITEFTGQITSISSLYVVPPYSLIVKDFKLGEMVEFEELKIEPSILSLFAGRFGFNKAVVKKPKIWIERIGEKKFNFQETISIIQKNLPSGGGKKKFIFVKDLRIQDASVFFEDQIASLSFSINPINLSVFTTFPELKTLISLNADAVSPKEDNLGNLSIDGWLNFLEKDADLDIALKELDLLYFHNYFKGNNFIKIDESKQVKLSFSANAVSEDNDLLIQSHIEVYDTQTKQKLFAMNLPYRTQFDKPIFDFSQIMGNIFKGSIVNISPQNIAEKIEDFKKTGAGFEAVGKELKDKFKDKFKDIGNIFKDFKIEKVEEKEGAKEEQPSENQESTAESQASQ